MAPHTLTDRQTFRATIAQVAAAAKAKLPTAVNGRLESAVALVLQGDVERLDDGTITVGSTTDATRYYRLTGQACTCADFAHGKAPEGWCQHRIAAGIQKRVWALLTASHAPEPPTAVASQPLPEAPSSANVRIQVHGYEVQVTLRDHDEHALLARLDALLTRYSLPARPATPQPTGQGKNWCSIHQTAMKQTTKDGRSWWSHRTAEGWCKGR
jgi:hypothetical protein